LNKIRQQKDSKKAAKIKKNGKVIHLFFFIKN